ncbi:MAG: ABC transporter substrate-binding protein [Microcystis aeruginosa K13-06]|nr:ABC transporter substrate-binding protein [Microcystis aeruginosa K13-06]
MGNEIIKIIKIFLASSSELKDDREQFEIFINRKNKKYIEQGIFLELVVWEDFIDAMSKTRLQDEYNKAITECHIFVSLFHTKVGKYTEEEFLKALETFKANGNLRIYTYFKNAPINAGQIGPEIMTLLNFKERLHNLGHFHTSYADINDLKHKFSEQLNKIMPKLAGEIEPAFHQEQQEIEQALKREIQQLEQQKQEIEQALRREIQQLKQQINGHGLVTPLGRLIVNITNTINLFCRWLIELDKWFKFAILCILALILSLVIFYVREITDPLSACNNTPDFISCGEKLDFPHYFLGQLLPEEEKGREEFANGNYKEAISYLEKAWEKEKDPVTLIALNNARVMYQLKSGTISPKNVFTIAVSTGFGDKIPPDFGGSILTGVGWQQAEFNKDNVFKLIVVMANDSNNKDGALKVAKELVGRERIIGVIGPYSSHATYYVLDDYLKELVLISPTSTATIEYFKAQNKNKSQDLSWFFRPIPTTEIAAKNLVKYLEKKGYIKVIIFYDNDLVAQSFYENFTKQLKQSSINIKPEVNITKSPIDLDVDSFKQKFNQLKDKTALVIISDAFIDTESKEKKIQIIKENRGTFLIAGNNPLFNDEVLELVDTIGRESLEKMVIAIPWYPSDEESKKLADFVDQKPLPWSTKPKLNWQMAMAYDATKMLVEAIVQQLEQGQMPSREGTRNTLAKDDFNTEGLTGKITLKGSDREDQSSSLISPDCSTTPCDWRKINP